MNGVCMLGSEEAEGDDPSRAEAKTWAQATVIHLYLGISTNPVGSHVHGLDHGVVPANDCSIG